MGDPDDIVVTKEMHDGVRGGGKRKPKITVLMRRKTGDKHPMIWLIDRKNAQMSPGCAAAMLIAAVIIGITLGIITGNSHRVWM